MNTGPPQPQRLHFHSHPRDPRGVIQAEASGPPRGAGRVSEGHEPLALGRLCPPAGTRPSLGPRSLAVSHAVPAATWTSSSRPSQKGTPCSSRTLARQWTLCWTPSWAGTRSRRGSEWPRPPPRSQAREPSRRPGPPARSGACRARPLPPGGQQGLRRSAAGVREPQVPEGRRSCGATSPPRVPASFYQDDLQTADLHGHVFISVHFSNFEPMLRFFLIRV